MDQDCDFPEMDTSNRDMFANYSGHLKIPFPGVNKGDGKKDGRHVLARSPDKQITPRIMMNSNVSNRNFINLKSEFNDAKMATAKTAFGNYKHSMQVVPTSKLRGSFEMRNQSPMQAITSRTQNRPGLTKSPGATNNNLFAKRMSSAHQVKKSNLGQTIDEPSGDECPPVHHDGRLGKK